MKIFYLSTILVCAISTVGLAQQQTGLEYGLQVGYNRSGIDFGSADFTGSKTIGGFNAGIYADMYFSDRWSFKAKMSYDQKGFAQKEEFVYFAMFYNINQPNTSAPQIIYNNINVNYITVPLTVDWHFGKKRGWYLDFGPYVGFILSAKYTQNSYVIDTKSEYNNVEGGFSVGAGYKVPIFKRLKLFVEYDMQNGFTNRLNSAEDDGSKYQNVRGSLDLGIIF